MLCGYDNKFAMTDIVMFLNANVLLNHKGLIYGQDVFE